MPDTVHPPLSVILTWPKPNYVNPENRGPGLIYVCIILSILGILTVSARVYSRLFITKAPGIDDILIVISLTFGIALSTLIVIDNKNHGSGYHVWDIPPDDMAGHRLNVWGSQWCYIMASCSVKISILLFYRRLSVKFRRSFLVATWIGIIYNICYLLAFYLVLMLQCRPIRAYWMASDRQWEATHNYKCTGESVILPMSAALSVISDTYSSILPMTLIWGSKDAERTKLSLYALFALGFLVVGAGIARTIALNRVINLDYDSLYVLWDNWIWTVVELYVSIVAASAPALKPLFRKVLGRSDTGLSYTTGRPRMRAGNNSNKQSPFEDWKSKAQRLFNGRRERGLPRDIETIGIAHGGSESTKSAHESFVREVDNHDLETRHYELRTSRDGKIIPTQIWKKSDPNNISFQEAIRAHEHDQLGLTQTNTWPVLPSSTYQPDTSDEPKNPSKGHTKNFSLPQIPKYDELPEPKKSRVNVTTTKICSRAHSNKAKTRSCQNSKKPALHVVTTSDPLPGVASKLDSPSDSEAERPKSEKLPWNTIYSMTPSHSRIGSDETLHLPRMGVPTPRASQYREGKGGF